MAEVPVNPIVHWLGAGGMAIGAVVIGGVTLKSRWEDVSHGILHLFVCLVALLAYTSFIFDRAAAHIDGRSFYVPHYVYWVVTFPLIAVALAVVALPPLENMVERRLRASIMGGLAGTSVLWASAALFQAFARTDAERWSWFALSMAAGIALVWQLWVPVLHQGEIKGGKNLSDYKVLTGSFTAAVFAYQALSGSSARRASRSCQVPSSSPSSSFSTSAATPCSALPASSSWSGWRTRRSRSLARQQWRHQHGSERASRESIPAGAESLGHARCALKPGKRAHTATLIGSYAGSLPISCTEAE